MGNPFLDMLFNPYGGGLGGANRVDRPRPSANPRDLFARDIFTENLAKLRQQNMSEGAQAILAARQQAGAPVAAGPAEIGSPEYDADRQREMVLGANPNYRPTGMDLTPAQRVVPDTLMAAAAASNQGRDEANDIVDRALANSPEGRQQAFAKAMQQKQLEQAQLDASDKAAKAETFDRWQKKYPDKFGTPPARPYQFPEISPERLAANQAKAADLAQQRAQAFAQKKAMMGLDLNLARVGYGPAIRGANPLMSMLANGGGEDFMRMMALQNQAQLGWAGLSNQRDIAAMDREAHMAGTRDVRDWRTAQTEAQREERALAEETKNQRLFEEWAARLTTPATPQQRARKRAELNLKPEPGVPTATTGTWDKFTSLPINDEFARQAFLTNPKIMEDPAAMKALALHLANNRPGVRKDLLKAAGELDTTKEGLIESIGAVLGTHRKVNPSNPWATGHGWNTMSQRESQSMAAKKAILERLASELQMLE